MTDPKHQIEFLWRRLEEPPELFGMPLDFHPLWWLGIGVPLLLLALALVGWIYLRESKTVGKPWGAFLGLCRTLVILTLFVIWLLPATRVVEWSEQQSRVVMLFDVSASTQTSDDPPAESPGVVRRTRQDLLLDLLTPPPAPVSQAKVEAVDFLGNLVANNPLVCYRFGEQLDPNPWTVSPAERPDAVFWANKLQPAARPTLAEPVLHDTLQELTRAGQLLRQTAELDPDTRERRRKELVVALERTLAEQQQIRDRLLNRTNLGVALRDVLRKEARNRVQGLVVFSDGHANAGSDQELAEAVKLANDNKIPLFLVGLGQRRDLPNLRLVDVLAPSTVQPEDEFPVRVAVEGENVEKGRDATVALLVRKPGAQEPEVVQKTVTLQPTTGRLSGGAVEFRVANPDKLKGEWKFTARVVPIPGERARADNASAEPVIVKVAERKPSILLLASAANHDYQFLRTMLVREQDKFDLTVCLQNAVTGTVQDVDPKRLLDTFPTDLRTPDEDPNNLGRYDVIVAFDPDWRQLAAPREEGSNKPTAQENLRKWVDQFGGGLVVIAGPVHTFTLARHKDLGTIRALYPVVLDDTATAFTFMERPTRERWALNWGPAAAQQPFFDLNDTGDPAKALQAWEEYFEVPRVDGIAEAPARRGFYSFFPLKDVKPAATVLARFSDPDRRFLTPRGERQPFFVTHKVGKGSVFYVGSPETYRLREFSDQYYERFWAKLIRAMAKRETPRGLLVAGSRYAEGETVTVEAQLFDAELKPLDRKEYVAGLELKVTPPADLTDVKEITVRERGFEAFLEAVWKVVKQRANLRDPVDAALRAKTMNEWLQREDFRKEVAPLFETTAVKGEPGRFQFRFAVRRAARNPYVLELRMPGSNERLTGKFRVETTDPERDDTAPRFAVMHRLAAEAKEVRLQDEKRRPEFARALARAREKVVAEGRDAPPGVTVLTPENQAERLFFDLESAKWIPECLEGNTTPFRTEGKVSDLWDKGWTVFGDVDHPDNASGPPWALVLLVLLLSAEWLTRKLLKLA